MMTNEEHDTLIEMIESHNINDFNLGQEIFLNMNLDETCDLITYWGKKVEYNTLHLPPEVFNHLKDLQDLASKIVKG